MAPKIFNMTRIRFAKLRKATLAAFLAWVPTSTDEALDFTVGSADRPSCVAPVAIPAVVVAPPPSLPSIDFDITREDARLTCHNTRRGTTAEFLIETVRYGALAGKRIASVLIGDRFEGFAFVDDFGLTVWTKKRGGVTPSTFDRYAAFLTDLSGALSKGVSIEIERID